jgi:hypothetical protein
MHGGGRPLELHRPPHVHHGVHGVTVVVRVALAWPETSPSARSRRSALP